MSIDKVFGIDLGTTYSCIAQMDRFGRPEVISNMDGDNTTPSVVQFQGDDVVVGKLAKRSARIDPDNVAQLVKRHMGDTAWRFHAGGREWSAPAVSALILGALVKDAERATGEQVKDVVITVPAYFGTEVREQTKLAGELAGLNVLDIINEPTAAAYSYGFAQDGSANETILVYDLGGGTFDTTIIALGSGNIRVVATDGDHELGGANWDAELAGLLAERFLSAQPQASDPFDDVYSEADLVTQAEEVKQSLTQRETAEVLVVSGADRASVSVTRGDFEEVTRSLMDRTIELTRRTVDAAAREGVTQIDRVLLVGGSSKMPAVARRLKEAFGYDGQLADPDLAVAKGAALFGQKLMLERTVEEATGRGVDLTKAMADAAAAHGMTSEAVKSVVETQIVNVCSRGFGVVAQRDNVDTAIFLVHQNDAVPVQVEETFYTMVDDQSLISVEVFEQGGSEESESPADNNVLIRGQITDLPPGYPQGTAVTVRMQMGRDGILTVTAHHAGQLQPLTLQVDTTSSMTPEQIAAERSAVSLHKKNL
ncbi:Chaperone protein DnaK [Paraconexibacter sp. AEG42_29]|uniref:Chaperone protein DnaK n=1 Tax=Paraconexibacter sp. AEG42_29 TaxID=2997339 RepID=A0AAU7AVZ6_9ACTN